VVFIDAIVVKVRDGQVANRPIYVAIGVTCAGERDILGLWAGDGGEGAKFWLAVLTEIKNRGTTDVCIVVYDGLNGLSEAVSAVWVGAIVQTCVIHLLRNTFRYASRKYWNQIAKDIRPVSTARTEAAVKDASWSSPRNGMPTIPPSSGCGRTPGASSCHSWTTTRRSAGSSAAQMQRSSRSMPATGARSAPAAISRPNKLPSNTSPGDPFARSDGPR
jgi:hypothetical protein